MTRFSILLFVLSLYGRLFSSVPQQRYSDQFYAAQKCFYQEALKKFPKLSKEKVYPEVPLSNGISKEELARIPALSDFLEARRQFVNEIAKYPELLYPDVFRFLYNHPALQVSASNKLKFEALEQYFSGFNFLFCNDRYYYFHPNTKANPCPLIYVYNDPKKNLINIPLSNSSKTGLSLLMSENLFAERLLYPGKRPISLKGGNSTQVKLQVITSNLQKDSTFRVINISFYDPAQPKIKIMVPLVLLPSSEYLKAGAQFFALQFSYNSHLKNIDLYSDRNSGPEPCSDNNCSGSKQIPNRYSNRSYTTYNFAETASVQYHLLSRSPWPYHLRKSKVEVEFNELGELQGKARDCPGPVPNSAAPCPKETANNGKELYGSRKIELKFFVPAGLKGELDVNLNYSDAVNTGLADLAISWLDQKKLMIQLMDEKGNTVYKQILKSNTIQLRQNDLPGGLYTISIFPVTEDSPKQNPAFEIKHLNNPARAHFDFQIKASFTLNVY